MSKIITLKKGLNIHLKGKAAPSMSKAERTSFFAVKPTDFFNLSPKMIAKVGDEVKVGSALFYDKYKPEVKFTSPVSGKVSEIRRGERRKILEVVVEAAPSDEYLEFRKGSPKELSKEEISSNMLASGIWPSIRQRPYNIIANPADKPKAIFISGFDTAPLAADIAYVLQNKEKEFQTGIDALSKLTEGKIHFSLSPSDHNEHLKNFTGIEYHYFKGPHPAGNVGVQIHHIDPINKGELIWVIHPQDVVIIGKLFIEGKYMPEIGMALCGSELENTQYYEILKGSSVENLLANNLKQENVRVISGNVLTGEKIAKEGFLGYYHNSVTVIPEGDYFEMFGWATLGFGKHSATRAFWSWLNPKKEYRLDTNYHGGERAFIFTGQYDKVVPMDIYPVPLLKSILIEDIDQMEQLGIFEISDEDFALCDYVCTSKIEAQEIVRKGIEIMIKELG